MKNILILIAAFSLTSCSLFYKTIFGIKDPKIETYYSINQYAAKIDIDSALVVFTKDSASYVYLNRTFVGSPEIIVFNKSKKFIPYKSDSINCNASIDTFLQRICTTDTVNMPGHKLVDYNSFISKIDDHNKVLSFFNHNEFDFIIFADFAKYFHKVNKNHIPGWNKALKDHSGTCRVKMIYVNLDYLNTWNISKSSLPTLRLSPDKK